MFPADLPRLARTSPRSCSYFELAESPSLCSDPSTHTALVYGRYRIQFRCGRYRIRCLRRYRSPRMKKVLASGVTFFDIIISSLSSSRCGSCVIHVIVSQPLTLTAVFLRSHSVAFSTRCLEHKCTHTNIDT